MLKQGILTFVLAASIFVVANNTDFVSTTLKGARDLTATAYTSIIIAYGSATVDTDTSTTRVSPGGLSDFNLLDDRPTSSEKKYGTGTPTPAGDCVSPTAANAAACKKNRDIAARQITVGVGVPAPTITALQFTSGSCTVNTSVGGGVCKEDASQTCPTAHDNGTTKCFWKECPGSCANTGPDSGDEAKPGAKTPEEIRRDLLNKEYPDSIAPGETTASCVARGVCKVVADASDGSVISDATGGDVATKPVGGTVTNPNPNPNPNPGGAGDVATKPVGGTVTNPNPGADAVTTPVGGDTPPGYTQSAYTTDNPTRVTPSPNDGAIVQRTPNGESPYRSLRTARSLQNPQSFIQKFAGDSPLAQLARFATGGDLRNSPEGNPNGQPQVIYVTQGYAAPNTSEEYRSIEEIASDISAQTPTALARVDHFARTLSAVGGPNSIDTENKAYGRIQDLIVEDEAIRALRVAEEEGKRAKDSVFCRTNETAESCNLRREEKAKEVERRVFIEELEKRVLPQTAIEHFLAVYDGWVRPSPAPDTYATSALATLHAQDLNPLADYEITTGGANFVWWVIESVADATTAAIDTLVNLITGGDAEEEVATPVTE